MYVYVVQKGCYSDRDIVGVFATPEAAMAEWPFEIWSNDFYEPGEGWTNKKHWERHLEIRRYDVQGAK